jgi:hypothetical protein
MSSYICEHTYDIEEGEAPPPPPDAEKEGHKTSRGGHKHHHHSKRHHREHHHRHEKPQIDMEDMEPSPFKAEIGRERGLYNEDDMIENDGIPLQEEEPHTDKRHRHHKHRHGHSKGGNHDTLRSFSEANEFETKEKDVEYVNLAEMPLDSVPEEEQHAPSFEPIMQAQEPQPNAPGAFRVCGPGVDSTVDDEEEFTVTPESTDGQQENGDRLLSAVLVDPEQDRREIEHEVEERLEQERAERERELAAAEPMSKYWCTPRARILGVSVLFLITVAIVTVAVVMTSMDKSPPAPAASTLDIPPALSWFVERVPQSPSFEEGTAQYDALEWLISEIDVVGEYDDENQLQFFSLAVLYFSTDGDNWINGGRNWLIRRIDERLIGTLNRSENNLRGRIPPEIGLLSTLMGKYCHRLFSTSLFCFLTIFLMLKLIWTSIPIF